MSSGYNARGQQNTLPLPRPLQAFRVAVVLLLLWLLVWLRLSWPYSLDDALIHLRYADHLLHLHRITYNGSSPSFGTSSLLYVGLLASLRAVWTSPMLPRVLSSVVHVGTFLLLATVLWRDLRVSDARRTLRALLAVALLATLVAPSAVRWLDDGMETSLTFLDALLGVLLLRRLLRAEVTQGLQFAAVLFGFLTVLLRVEMLLLPFFVSLVLLFSSFSAASAAEKRSRRFMGTLPVAGAVAAAGLIFLSMHALLPDTALAKAFGFGAWRSTLHMAELTLASSFSFGVGLLLLWLLSCGTLAVSRVARWSDALPNLLFPLLLLAALVRGQAIQGIRYFAWTLFFPLLWNLLRLSDTPRLADAGDWRGEATFQSLVAVLLLGMVPAFAWESRTFQRIFAQRGEALDRFRQQVQLDRLQGLQGIAEDVGFVGYFTKGDICDPYGLVNGRTAARLSYDQRFAGCIARHPAFVFGSDGFLHKVDPSQHLNSWLLCGRYNFENVHSHDVHYLLVKPELRAACPGGVAFAEAEPGLL